MLIFMSAWQSKLTNFENMANTADLQSDLHKLGLRPELVLGTYMGGVEQSFAVAVADDDVATQQAIQLLAGHWNQHSIMQVDKHMQAKLVFLGERLHSPLGELKQVSTDCRDITFNQCASYWRGAVWVAQ